MTKYEVRCCCRPESLLGTIDLPDSIRGDVVSVSCRDGTWARIQLRVLIEEQMQTAESIGEIKAANRRIVAVSSDDRPIEFWRTVVGFVEAKGAA